MDRKTAFVVLGMVLVMGVVSAWAQTPMDLPMLSLRTFFQSVFAPIAVIVLGIVAALSLFAFTSAPGSVVIGVFIFFTVASLIAAAANGTLLAFFGLA